MRRARPQPIRDAILTFLERPRSAAEVARHIDRPVPVATGHLAAMRRRGLVLRLGFSAYALAGYQGPALRWSTAHGKLVPLDAGDPVRTTPEENDAGLEGRVS